MKWAYVSIVVVSACTSSMPRRDPMPISATVHASATPPDLTAFTLVEEGSTGPLRPELLPYVRRRPLVRITQWGSPEESPPPGSFDLAVFDDGKVFFEGERCVTASGLRVLALSNDQLLALRRALEKHCPTLQRAQGFCTDSSTVEIACHLGNAEFLGSDKCSGRAVEWGGDERGPHAIAVVAELITKAGADAWVGHGANPQCSFGEHYAAKEIARTLAPIPWKRYVRGHYGADLQPGVAADGAAPRR